MEGIHHVYLVPGFFGFANLGDLAYFGHAREFLLYALQSQGRTVHVHVVPTPPTSSLTLRATRLLETIVHTAGRNDGHIHLIGHSSGGLDIRLLMSPGTQLPTAFAIEPYIQRVRSVVTVSTPHRGTPLASFFTSLMGQKLLELFSLSSIYAIRLGRMPIHALAKFVWLFSRSEPTWNMSAKEMEEVEGELLRDFSPDRRSAITQFLHDVRSDQGLMLQLAPTAMELFNVSTPDRPDVRYGSVVTRARAPGLSSRLSAGLSPYAHATRTLYDAVYRIASGMEPSKLAAASERFGPMLFEGFGSLPTAIDNDGIVPTLSQPWGQVLACARGDHLDIIGHFDDVHRQPAHRDWLATGTGFDRLDFERIWRKIAGWLMES